MAYATVAELREQMPQVATGATNDALLQTCLNEATAYMDGILKFSFAAYGTAAAKDVRCRASGEYLELPDHQAASITSVYEVSSRGATYEATEAITDYVLEEDVRPYRLYRYEGWTGGTYYRVTAKWGHGPVPDDVKRVCKELAFTLWQARQSSSPLGTVGVDGGGAVVLARALTAQQRAILDNAHQSALGLVHG